MEYIGRIVTGVVTPILAGLSASFAIWAADNLPGSPQVDDTALATVGAAAALAVGAAIYKWLDNLGKHERQQAELDNLPQVD